MRLCPADCPCAVSIEEMQCRIRRRTMRARAHSNGRPGAHVIIEQGEIRVSPSKKTAGVDHTHTKAETN